MDDELKDDQDQVDAGDIAGYTSPTQATNPYTDRLSSLIDKYLTQTETQAAAKKKILDDATKKLLSQENDRYRQAMEAFRIAGALGKPTKTGSFGESLGYVSEAAADLLKDRVERKEKLEDLMAKYRMAGLDTEADKLKTQINAISTLARTAPRAERMTEVERLSRIVSDANAPQATRDAAAARIKKLTYIKPESAAAEGPKSPAGKIATDMGLTPGTEEYKAKVAELTKADSLSEQDKKRIYELDEKVAAGKEVVAAFSSALQLNDVAYEGRTAGAREVVGSVIPGVRSSEAQTATADLENIVLGTALTQLKAIFGAAPTEGERKILIDVQGSINKPAPTRAAIWKRAQAAAARRIQDSQRRISEIKTGALGRKLNEPESEPAAEGMAHGGQVQKFENGGLSLANVGRSAAQGLALGFGDEAIARVRAKMEGRPYEDVLAEERAAYKSFTEKYPLTSLGSEIVGGIVPTVGSLLLPGGQAAAPVTAGRTAQLMSRVGQAVPQMLKSPAAKIAGTGAATGTVSGLGTAEGTFSERLPSALGTGLASGIAGPILAKGVTTGGNVLGRAYNMMRPSQSTAEKAATRKVLQAMGRDEMTIDDVRQQMARERGMGVESTLADVSPSMKSLGEASIMVPGKGRRVLGEVMEERLEEGREKVGQRVLQSIGKGADFTQEMQNLTTALRKNASPLYKEAYQFGEVYDPKIMKVLENDTFKRAYQEARKIIDAERVAAELRGEDVSQFMLKPLYQADAAGNITKVDIPDVRTLDYIKRGMDQLIEKGYSSQDGLTKADARALQELKKVYMNTIDQATIDPKTGVSKYAEARKQYAGDFEVLQALKFGKDDFLTTKTLPAEAQKIVDGMSVAEKDALRAGVAQSILTKIMDSPQQINAAQKVIGAPSTRKRLATLFDTPQEYEMFETALVREAELFRNAQEMIRNSRTANRQEALKDLKNPDRLFDIAGEAIDASMIGSPGSIVGRVLKFIQARATMDERTAGEVASILRASDPQEVAQALAKLEQQSSKFATGQARRGMTEKAIGAETGIIASQPPDTPTETGEQSEEDVDETIRRLTSGQD